MPCISDPGRNKNWYHIPNSALPKLILKTWTLKWTWCMKPKVQYACTYFGSGGGFALVCVGAGWRSAASPQHRFCRFGACGEGAISYWKKIKSSHPASQGSSICKFFGGGAACSTVPEAEAEAKRTRPQLKLVARSEANPIAFLTEASAGKNARRLAWNAPA